METAIRSLSRLRAIVARRLMVSLMLPLMATLLLLSIMLPQLANAAITYGAIGNVASGTTTLSVPYPTGITAGQLLVLIVGNKYPTNVPTTPSGWTQVAQGSGGLGSAGTDSGQVYSTVFVKQATGTETGNLSVAIPSANTSMARILRYTKSTAANWDYAATSSAVNVASTAWSATGTSNPGITAGDVVIVGSARNGNRLNNWGSHLLTATGATISANTERSDSTSGTGDDMGFNISEHPVSAGTATAVPRFTMTGSGGSASANSPSGVSTFLRLRELPATQLAFSVQPSDAASGAAISPAIKVEIRDALGNLVTSSTATVTLAIGTNPGGGTLTGTSVSAVAGVATFSATSINATGAGYTLVASSSGLTSATSNTFSIRNVPTVSTGSASPITATTATLNGTVSSNGAATTVSFDYGTSTSYGSSVTAATSPLAGSASNSAVTGALTGLTCNTTYHFRVKASNSASVTPTLGTDATFTTGACGTLTSATNSTISASPTTVVADNNASATVTVTLKDSGGALLQNKLVTLTANSTTATIVAVSATTNASGVATFTVSDSTVGTVTYTAAVAADGVTLTNTAQVTYTAATCFYDNFSGSALNANWTTGKISGSFTPSITGNRLRLTDTGGSESTWVTLNKYFPGAGNQITVEFDHLAYGGTGADGMAVIISDASVTPAAGAFGGSLGYAPKSNPGSDCTTVGGCVGFAGGWMGVALDEFGNFSNATEGRYGGTGFAPDSVAIRGSGSGMSGYRFITGTGTLSTGIDGSFSPLHKYRVIVDHSDATHAWVSVERSTNGGSSYSTLIGDTACTTAPTASCLDIKASGYSQDPVPANWRLSFAGSSGGSTNTHEFDTLKVCTAKSIVSPTLHHLELNHSGQGCTGSPTTITLKACADAACSVLYPDSVSATLTATKTAGTTGTATWVSSPVTFTGGTKTVTLSYSADATLDLGATVSSPTPSSAASCNTGTSTSCSLSVATCVLDAVETTATAAFTPIYTKLSGSAFSLDVRNLDTAAKTLSAVQIFDASTDSCNGSSTLASATSPAVPFTLSGSAKQAFSFNYAQSAKNVRVRMTVGATKYCSSDNFAIRPTGFSTTVTPTVARASSDAITVAVLPSSVTNYTDTPKYIGTNVTYTPNPTAGTITPTVSGFFYSEVGSFTLPVQALYDDQFTAVDSNKAQPDCTSDFSNTLVNNRYGCMFRNDSDAITVGRYIPDHFDTMISAANASNNDLMACATTVLTSACTASPCACPASGLMAYSAQPFTASITAKNGDGLTTRNYAGTYAHDVQLSLVSSNGGSVFSPPVTLKAPTSTTVSSASFSSGVAAPLSTYTFTTWPSTTPVAPVDIYLRASESPGADNVSSLRTSNPTSTSVEGGLRLLSGRLLVDNMYGPPGANLQTKVRQLYYTTAGSWLVNTAGVFAGSTASLKASSNFSLGTPNYGATASTLTASSTSDPCKDVAGVYCLVLTKPTSGSGNRAVTVSGSSALSAYLPGSGTVTWGVFRAPYIYMRER